MQVICSEQAVILQSLAGSRGNIDIVNLVFFSDRSDWWHCIGRSSGQSAGGPYLLRRGVAPQSGMDSTNTCAGSLPAKPMACCSNDSNSPHILPPTCYRYWLLTPIRRETISYCLSEEGAFNTFLQLIGGPACFGDDLRCMEVVACFS